MWYENPSGVEIRPESVVIGSRDQLRHNICQAMNHVFTSTTVIANHNTSTSSIRHPGPSTQN